MTTPSSSRLRWSWKGAALALLVSVSPTIFQVVTGHNDVQAATTASDGLTIAPASIVVAVCLYTVWRISSATSPTWIVAGGALLGVQSVSIAALQVAHPHHTAAQHAWMALADLLVLATVLGLRWLVCRPALRHRNAFAIGAAAGLAVGTLRVVAVSRLPHLEPTLPYRVLVAVVGISLAGTLCWLLLRAAPLPLVVRERLVAGVLLLTASHTVTNLDGAVRDPLNSSVALACSVVGSMAFLGAGIGLLRRSLTAEVRLTRSLRTRLELVEEDQRRHRARMHEIESMMAGIISASELLRDPARVPADRRAHLEEMIHDELGRLERLLRRQRAAQPTVPLPRMPEEATVDLDRTLRHLALAHEAKGTTVRWLPSGRRVSGHPDDITEVLNILLDNAARHGDAAASVSVQEAPHAVEILVSDNGPGIAPEIREQLFQWGARGPSSPGQGIGLHIAKDLVTKAGGYLNVRDPEPDTTERPAGATFVIGLPRPEAGDGVLA